MNIDHGRRPMKLRSSCRSLFAGLLLTCLAAPMALAQPGPDPSLPSVPTFAATPAAASAPATSIGEVIAKNKAGTVAAAANYTSYPVINASSAAPLVMLVMSRDEQLFIKAYPDYTDLDGDGVVDTTYNDHFDYSGYFDSNLCYTYAGSQFKAAAQATGGSAANGQKNHKCSGNWSGNFLNWVAMSRLDVVRFVLAGGYRKTDTSTTTVLERADIPNDLHAWAKVYMGSDVSSFTPYSQVDSNSGISFCNATVSSGGAPQLRVARGNWSEWASTAQRQCDWKANASTGANGSYNDVPDRSGDSGAIFTVRVQVCDSSPTAIRESFCQRYSNNGTDSYKPVGLLQRYGENGQMRFGLLTGSFSAPRSGGVLRRNIGRLAGNGANPVPTSCVAGDEIKLSDGTFCNQGSGDEGIINTLSRLKLTQWNFSANWNDCNTYGILNRDGSGGGGSRLDNPGTAGGYACSAWGNPLSEMYAEALRYIAADGEPFSAFTEKGDLAGLPAPSWKDPYGSNANPYCAACSVIVLSTGLNSFDSDELPTWMKSIGMDAPAATKIIGADEKINGNDYLVGRVVANQNVLDVGKSVNTYEDLCSSKNVTDLSLARGLCPDIPSMEGSYLISGLAFQAWTKDMRPDLKSPDGNPRPSGYKNTVQTYAIALAENLPKFQIPLGKAGAITLAPLCQANNSGTAKITGSGWRSCYLGAVGVGTKTSRVDTKYIYGRPLLADADGTAGSYSLVWEDSLWGNDHDNDVVSMLTYCVGDACKDANKLPGNSSGYDICWKSDSTLCTNSSNKPSVGDNEALVRIENLSAYAGNAMLTGYTITGSNDDGVKRLLLRPGNSDASVLTSAVNAPTNWDKPKVIRYTLGTNSAKQLENPLFYAAKYGGFTKAVDGAGDVIEQPCDSTTAPACTTSNWDQVDNDTGVPGSGGKGDGLPDNFFPVRNPAQLGERLASVFNAILTRSGSGTSAAVVSSSAAGDGLTYQALYQAKTQNTTGSQSATWTGALNALWTDANGRLREGGYAPGGVPTLGDYDENPIVMFCTTTDGDSRFLTYTSEEAAPDRPIEPSACTGQSLDQLKTVWSAQTLLSAGTYQTAVQRGYGSPATTSNGRYIFTWLDANHDGKVDANEQRDFDWGTGGINGSGTCDDGSAVTGNFRFLNTCSAVGAEALVGWTRGTDYTGTDGMPDPAWRSRTVDDKVYRLGDIINSTPLAVGTPAEAFDLLYNDSSYGKFRKVYQQRRQMIYVGANDGMLHAFNGGFYDAAAKQLNLQPIVCTSTDCSLDGNFTQHPLGSEVWAYVPGNLLPHLRWLADPDYVHMFYVDGSPISQDVRIFEEDTDCEASSTTQCHPDGWGTILIVPFRFGGGPITLDTKEGTDVTQQSSFSAYVVLDVTNPEAKPTVLAELTNTDGTACDDKVVSCSDLSKVVGTYTSSLPAVAMFRPSGTVNPDPSKFVLFTGSGSTDNGGVGSVEGGEAVSSSGLRIQAYDLSDTASGNPTPMTWGTGKNFVDLTNTTATNAGANSFAGDLIASDFNLNGVAESLYFGSTKGAAVPFSGALWAIDFNDSTDAKDWLPRQVLSGLDKPITIRPTLGLNDNQQRMIFFGTGRVYTKNDLGDKSQQVVAGVIDAGSTVAYSDLLDVTDVAVTTDGDVSGATDASLENINELAEAAEATSGWKYELEIPEGSSGTTLPSERVIATQVLSGGALVTTSYIPGTDQCTDQGTGRMYAMNYRTGTADVNLAGLLGTTTPDSKVINKYVDLGKGLPSQPSLHKGGTGPDGDKKLRACVQTSSGAIICQDLLPLESINSGEISWREPLTK